MLDVLAVADGLKTIARRGRVVLPDGATRRENSAEPCWSRAPVAVPLQGEVSGPFDLGRALTMIAIDDLVEIEAGDTFACDAVARFAMACGRRQGVLQKVLSGGQAWRDHGVTRAGTLPRMAPAMGVDAAFAALIGRLYDRAEEMRLLGPHS